MFAAAFSVRMFLVWWQQLHAEPFRAEIQSTAVSLVTLGVFGNEYAVPTGPTAHVSPLHTLLLAGVFQIFGTGVNGELASLVLNAALAAALYSAIPATAARLGFPAAVGIAAGWFGALFPFHYLNELRSGDSQVAALILMGVVAIAFDETQRPALGWRLATVRGALWAAAVLTLPPLILVIVALVLVSRWRQPAAQPWRPLLLSTVVALVLVSPWALRNAVVLGTPIWTRSNLGIELRVAFNDLAWPDIDRNRTGGAWDRYHPSASVPAAEQLGREGEVEFNHRLRTDSLEWMYTHPARAATLIAQRTVFFWLPFTQRPLQRLFLSALSLCALWGLYLMYRDDGPLRVSASLFAAIWLAFPVVYYLTQAAVRYRYPMVWTLLLAAALAVHQTAGRFRRRAHRAQPLREGR